ncbi:MAG: helix-turn-helix transcriptional regulator [Candidatus Odinarchaeota archaeon]|nr:helix-turn-helix transcriptional regulator [Candidatus Odinarchaeota archaeon]
MKILILKKLKDRFGVCANELNERFKGCSVELPTHNELRIFKALKVIFSNELRVKIVFLLAQEELPVCALVAILGKEQTLISHHLISLKQHNVVVERRIGKFRFYSLNKELLKEYFNVAQNRLRINSLDK